MTNNNISNKEIDHILNKCDEEVLRILKYPTEKVIPFIKTLLKETLVDLIKFDKRKSLVVKYATALNKLEEKGNISTAIEMLKQKEITIDEFSTLHKMSYSVVNAAVSIYDHGYINKKESDLIVNKRLHNVSWANPIAFKSEWFISFDQYESLVEHNHDRGFKQSRP